MLSVLKEIVVGGEEMKKEKKAKFHKGEVMPRGIVFGGMLIVLCFCLISCDESSSNPISGQPAQIISIGEFDIPQTATSWQYQFSDGSALSSSSFFDLGYGKKGVLIGATGRDTMVIMGNSLIGYYYSSGMRVVFGAGAGVLLEPAEIENGHTYSTTSQGYSQDYSFSVTIEVATRYKLLSNITVGTKTLDEALYVELTLIIKDANGNQLGKETTSEYRGKGLGTLKIVNTSGVTLKYCTKILIDGNTAFTS
jgi:hypothetical protein